MHLPKLGVSLSFVPEDRLGMGLVGNMDLDRQYDAAFSFRSGKSHLYRPPLAPRTGGIRGRRSWNVSTPSVDTPVRRLSGGNVQKVLVGPRDRMRADGAAHGVCRCGVWISIRRTRSMTFSISQKKNGVAVIFVGEDLDVLLELCDRILVLCGGKVSGIVSGRGAEKREVGMMMTKLGGQSHE